MCNKLSQEETIYGRRCNFLNNNNFMSLASPDIVLCLYFCSKVELGYIACVIMITLINIKSEEKN